MTTFALVHGGYHGAWCWEHVTPLLEKAGHDVVVMDLPLEDSSATFDTYAAVVCAALADCGDDVVLVGHSYAGNTIPLVAARRPLRHLRCSTAIAANRSYRRPSIGFDPSRYIRRSSRARWPNSPL